MPKNKYQIFLRKNATTYYKVVNGSVITVPTTTEMAVANWNELQIKWTRNTKYHGVFRTYGPETLQFVFDAATILRYIYNTQGSEGTCEVEIRELSTSDQLYYPLAIVAIDFSQYKGHKTDVVAGLMDGGLGALLKAYSSTAFDIPLGTDATTLNIVGIKMAETVSYVMGDLASVALSYADRHYLPMNYVSSDDDYPIGTGNLVTGIDINGDPIVNNIFTASQALSGTIKLHTKIKFTITPNDGTDFASTTGIKPSLVFGVFGSGHQHYSDTPTVAYSLWENATYIEPGHNQTVTIDAEIPFTLVAGDIVCIWLHYTREGDTGNAYITAQTTANVDTDIASLAFTFTLPGRRGLGYRQHTVFEKLTNLLTSGKYAAKSDFLTAGSPNVINLGIRLKNYDADPICTMFTCGDGLRNLSNAAIRMTMDDFIQDAFVRLQAGLGIEKDSTGKEVLVIEPLSHFYNKSKVLADLGDDISNMEISPYTEYLANNYTEGQKDQNYDEVNGKYEYNSEQVFKSPIVRTIEDVDYTTPFRADYYGIVFTAANLANKTTTDSSSDNDTFMLDVNIPGNTGVCGPMQAGSISGTLDPYATFNTAFSPERNLLRKSSFYKSIFSGLLNQQLTFTSATKNSTVQSNLWGTPVSEGTNVDFASSTAPLLFKPIVFSFDTKVPVNLATIMGSNPYGLIKFTYKGHSLAGFILEAGITPGTNATYNFKLLSSPDNIIPTDL